jgi:hypothetical protein
MQKAQFEAEDEAEALTLMSAFKNPKSVLIEYGGHIVRCMYANYVSYLIA